MVVAAGAGTRFGGPKQYSTLDDGRRMLDWSVAAARSSSDGVVLVVPPDRADDIEKDVDRVVAGGATRSDSVRAGLAAVPTDAAVILVHDAARPRASADLFRAVIAALVEGVDGAVPGVPLTDTVKQVLDGRVTATLDRAELVAVQTPQAFRAEALRRAHASNGDATDDAALVEAAGGVVVVVPGEPFNVKITRMEDL